MKIAMTSLYLPGGSKIGVGYQVHEMANQMTLRGHTVTVFSQCEAGEAALYKLEKVPARKKYRTFGFAWDLRDVSFSEFDVLHAHGDDWFLWGKKRPQHIHTFHGSCYAEFLHQHGLKERMRMLALAACEQAALKLCDESVGVSRGTRSYLPGIRHVIPNGVDLSRFTPSTEKASNPVVLFVGTIKGRKRGRLLLDAFKETVLRELPDAVLWAVCEEPVSGKNVQWLGRVPNDVLRELYRKAWVFCLPSSYEGFGIPYIEAMAAGTAVVATPNLGAVEVLQRGACGLLVSDRKLGSGIVQVLKDASLRRYLESAGLIRARQFGWNCVCTAYERLYEGTKSKTVKEVCG